MSALSNLLSSNTRAEFFRLLFSGQHSELHLRDISRQANSAIGTVQQEAANLMKLGLILQRRNGNRVYYSANSDHPLFGPIRELVLKTVGMADVLKDTLTGQDGIELAFIFGSIADGTAHEKSDIDLLVVGTIRLSALSKLLKEPAHLLGREINPHIFSRDEFRSRIRRKEHFIHTLMKGKRIYIVGTEDEFERMAS
ncbi:MAG: nucleotidyltransferase domain-containing protein [Fibrobacterota bacterium]